MSSKNISLKGLNINKSFHQNQVLFDVSIEIEAGSIHALVGENGAGKSTLMNILAGIHHKDSGTIFLDENEIDVSTPKKSQDLGIMLMHQELSIFPEMTVAENIFTERIPRNTFGFVQWKKVFKEADDILKKLECNFTAKQKVKELSLANKHLCEFARFMSMNPLFIILDEPTASLTEREKDIIFKFIKQLRDEHNLGILYISHRMHEIFEIADKVSVLRDGYMQGTFNIDEITETELTHLMVGYEIEHIHKISKKNRSEKKREKVLEVKGLSHEEYFHDVSFSIEGGEILGMAGLLGSRRTEIAEAIFGIIKPTAGTISIMGKQVNLKSVKQSIDNSIALVPGDRKLQGLVLGMSCQENLTLSVLSNITEKLVISKKKESLLFNQYRDMLSLKTSGAKQRAGELSGGNQQKVVLSKWLSTTPSLLILDEPTRGIDVGAKAQLYKLIQNLAEKGYAILLITSDMFELLTLSNRIIAIYEGEVSAELKDDDITEDSVVEAITRNLRKEKP